MIGINDFHFTHVCENLRTPERPCLSVNMGWPLHTLDWCGSVCVTNFSSRGCLGLESWVWQLLNPPGFPKALSHHLFQGSHTPSWGRYYYSQVSQPVEMAALPGNQVLSIFGLSCPGKSNLIFNVSPEKVSHSLGVNFIPSPKPSVIHHLSCELRALPTKSQEFTSKNCWLKNHSPLSLMM